jgi:phosphoribosyl-ATP pyrophosphohydrolase/phosphoribosyl-AMP cyclohydrolase/histidinol dehydrogenase
MTAPGLRTIDARDVPRRRNRALDPEALSRAAEIVGDVRERGEPALREYAARLDGVGPGQPLVLDRAALQAAGEALPNESRGLLARTADRIRRFAEAQRACLTELRLEIPGGAAGHTLHPVEAAGCYVPGGRYPLVSTMLMTVVTARTAGVTRVWAASPAPSPMMAAAASIAGADALLTVGGAHAIAALAYGIAPASPCDVIVGPGNRWVTAAKQVVSADVRIDMLAGPSELLILADDSADPRVVAADLLAQAEHDPDACPMLIALSAPLIDAVNGELARQLESLPTRATAAAALGNGFVVLARDPAEAIALCHRIAPEHLETHFRDADEIAPKLRGCGCLFIGPHSAEVLGDYGAGPNHTLPTGGTARFASGLSVFHFLRSQTWLRCDQPSDASALPGAAAGLLDDAIALARLEGLEAHARSAEARRL